MYGDPRNQPNPCLRPIENGPFYAMPIYPGDIGTNGGMVTNEKAQVIGENDQPIDGLYAIGNNAASSMGESYPGAGVTIGPALTFGHIAARHMSHPTTDWSVRRSASHIVKLALMSSMKRTMAALTSAERSSCTR